MEKKIVFKNLWFLKKKAIKLLWRIIILFFFELDVRIQLKNEKINWINNYY